MSDASLVRCKCCHQLEDACRCTEQDLLVDTARRHLCDAEELMERELPIDMPEREEAELDAEIEGHVLAASKIVLGLMDMGAFEEARAVQFDITRWVNLHTYNDPAREDSAKRARRLRAS